MCATSSTNGAAGLRAALTLRLALCDFASGERKTSGARDVATTAGLPRVIDLLPRMRAAVKFSGLLILALAGASGAAAAASALIGHAAPDFTLKGLDGRNLRLSEFRGQVVLLNFWARWVGDSRAQMTALDRINATYRRAGLMVIGVSMDEDQRRAREFATAMKLSYAVLIDNGTTVGGDYRIQKMPLTILIDRAGVVRYQSVGFKSGDEEVYVENIRELLRE
jgi:peroxiredoxin